ncbi:hypothetical protein E2C01_101552 [Portunus trituberculatus]|uniref:Saposin B-type domain-containing protein n=1 Tax=Portunus trituberculatus TaxID=210409 RepID=A0A5B7KGC1_PORTR|nr:hypothetical protein [Portunus trituberculatus]
MCPRRRLVHSALELDLGSLMLGGELDGGVRDGPRNLFFCTTCNLGVNEVLHSLQNGTDPMEIAAMITKLCINLGIASEKLCENFIALAEVCVYCILFTVTSPPPSSILALMAFSFIYVGREPAKGNKKYDYRKKSIQRCRSPNIIKSQPKQKDKCFETSLLNGNTEAGKEFQSFPENGKND